jgi:hypothetical protein
MVHFSVRAFAQDTNIDSGLSRKWFWEISFATQECFNRHRYAVALNGGRDLGRAGQLRRLL